MIQKNRELQEEFFNLKVKEEYSDVSFEQMIDIVEFNYKLLADGMKRGELPKVRHKYLGVFQVYVRRASYLLKSNKKKYDKNEINHDEYFKYKKILEDFICNHLEDKSKKYKEPVPEELKAALLNEFEPENKREFYFKYKKWIK